MLNNTVLILQETVAYSNKATLSIHTADQKEGCDLKSDHISRDLIITDCLLMASGTVLTTGKFKPVNKKKTCLS